MQIVIDIPSKYYEYCKNQEDVVEIELAIKNGVVLPEHHGRLIDADALGTQVIKDVCHNCERRKSNGVIQYGIGDLPCRACETDDMFAFLDNAPTVLEGVE